MNGTGRSPAGRLRNFRAMNDDKLINVRDQVAYENGSTYYVADDEALDALNAEVNNRFRTRAYS